MALPKLKAPAYKVTLPVSKQKIEYKPYVIGQERNFLTALESKKTPIVVENIIRLVNDCVLTEKFDINNLSLVDFMYLMLHLRAKSKGEGIDTKIKCSYKKCGKEIPYIINLEKDIVVKNKTKIKDTVKIIDNIYLEITPLSLDFLKEMTGDESKEDIVFKTLTYSVSKVISGTEIYTDFTEDELRKNIIDEFTETQLELVVNRIEKLIKLIVDIKTKCPHCKKEVRLKEENGPNFFF